MRSLEEFIKKILRRKARRDSGKIKKVFSKRKIHVYVCGPISFVEEQQDYRKSITNGLKKISNKFIIHDPWEREQVKFRGALFKDLEEEEERKQVAESIIRTDLKDIASCDILIAYLFRIGVGSAMEIFWAFRVLNKPVIVIYTNKEDGGQIPLWLYGNSDLIFRRKASLFRYLKKVLKEEEEEDED